MSVTALIKKESEDQKACKNLSGLKMRLYVKFEVRAFRNYVTVIPGHTDRQADTLFFIYIKVGEHVCNLSEHTLL